MNNEDFPDEEGDAKKQSALLAGLINSIPEIVFVKDLDGKYIAMNPLAADFTGMEPEQTIGKTDYDIFSKEIADSFCDANQKLIETKKPQITEEWIDHPVRGKVLLETYKALLQTVDNEIIGIIGVSRDITQRKLTNDVLKEKTGILEGLLSSLPEIVFMKDINGVYVGCNQLFSEFTGISVNDLVGKTDYDLFPKEVADHLLKNDQITLESQKLHIMDEWVEIDGKMCFFETYKSPLKRSDGELIGILGIARDISAQKELNDALRISEDNYKHVISSISNIIWRFNIGKNSEITSNYISPVVNRILGLEPNTIGNDIHKFFSYVVPEDMVHVHNIIAEAVEHVGKEIQIEFRAKRPDGKIIWLYATGKTELMPNGNLQMFGSTTDITERKAIEEDLKKKTTLFEGIIKSIPEMIFIKDEKGVYLGANDIFSEFMGHPVSELLGNDDYSFFEKDVAEVFRRADEETMDAGDLQKIEEWVDYPDGRKVLLETYKAPLFTYDTGKLAGIVGVSRDITERKIMEDAIREKSGTLEGLLTSMPEMVFMKDLDGKYITCNELFTKLTRASVEETIGKTDYDFFDKKSADAFRHDDRQAIEEDKLKKIEEWVDVEGKRIYLETYKTPLKKSDGELIGLLGIARDTTYQKELNDALRVSEDNYKHVISSISNIVWRIDINPDKTISGNYISPVADTIIGLKPGTIGNDIHKLFSYVNQEELTNIYESIQDSIENIGKEVKLEFRATRPDGKDLWLLTIGKTELMPDGNLQMFGSTTDITERKAMESDLRKKTTLFEGILKSIPEMIFIKDENGVYLGANDIFAEFIGHPVSELLGKDDYSFFEKDVAEVFRGADKETMDAGELQKIEEWVDYPDGRKVLLETYKAPLLTYDTEELAGIVGVSRDITERKLMEDAVRKSEEEYKRVLDSIPNIIWKADVSSDGTFSNMFVSSAAEKILGLEEGAINNEWGGFFKYVHPEDIDRLINFSDLLIENMGQQLTHEYRAIKPDGDIVYFYENGSATQNEDGTIQLLGTSIDITERKLMEEAIRESEEEYKRVLDSVPNIVWRRDINADGTFSNTLVSPAAEKILGLEEGTINNEIDTFLKYVHPDDMEGVIEYNNVFIENICQQLTHEYRIIRPDGKILWLFETGSTAYTTDGTLQFLGTTIDITERKEAEIRFKAASECTSDLVYEWDLKTDVVEWYGGIDKALGYEAEEYARTLDAWENSIHPEDRTETLEKLEMHKISGEPIDLEYRVVKKDGDIRYWADRGITFFDGNGKPYKYVGACNDVTEQRLAEIALNDSKLAAEEANRSKSEFLANMSHELRTPLNAVIGFSEMLEAQTFGEVNEKQMKYINNILTSGKHLLNLINDILDISKVEAGKMELHYDEFIISEAVRDVLNITEPLARKKRLDLSVDCESDGQYIEADKSKFKQILYNLISNAIKFTPEKGSIIINGTVVEDTLSISVIDTGIGISEEDQVQLFKPFKQVDSTTARQYAGTGLGLALVKQFAILHGGNVDLQSTPGEGSKFTLNIPLKKEEKEQDE